MNKKDNVYVAGHTGLVGSAVVRKLKAEGYENLILVTHSDLDLLNQDAVNGFFGYTRPRYVILCAALVGGIFANTSGQADFLYHNLQIQNNVIWAAFKYGVDKLLFLGSSCMYPIDSPQPWKEEYLLSGKTEPTNEGYAIAKIAGLKLCEKISQQYNRNFISLVPPNIYGPGDNFDPMRSHVVSGLIRRMHEAKTFGGTTFKLWGTGRVRREFLYVDDLALAIYWAMQNYNDSQFLNVGSRVEYTVEEVARIVAGVVGFDGKIVLDSTKADGAPRKVLDASKIRDLGFFPRVSLEEGVKLTYEWYKTNIIRIPKR